MLAVLVIGVGIGLAVSQTKVGQQLIEYGKQGIEYGKKSLGMTDKPEEKEKEA